MMIFGFLPQNLKTKAVAVAFSIAWLRGEGGARVEAARARDRLATLRRNGKGPTVICLGPGFVRRVHRP
jgi:hypothetical protein